jgi:WD40 repeat protein
MHLKKIITLSLLSFSLISCTRPSELTFKQVYTLKGHTKDIWSLAFNPNGKELLSGSADTTIKVWDMKNGELKNQLIRIVYMD